MGIKKINFVAVSDLRNANNDWTDEYFDGFKFNV
jgi:hypothetical protein